MADQPNQAMTLREAVEITRTERDNYADRKWLNSCMAPTETEAQRDDRLDANGIYAAAYARWDRARAIVDAAVEAHEARCKLADGEEAVIAPLTDEFMDWEEAFDKLRALERGEDAQ